MSMVTGQTQVPNPAETLPAAQGGDALATLTQLLNTYGLGGLIPWVQQQLIGGADATQIAVLLPQQPAFQQRFPGIAQRQANGLPPISPADYVNYEDSLAQLYRSAGLPQGFYDSPTDVANLIGNDVSINEMTARVQQGYVAALTAPQAVRDQLHTLYNVSQGGLAAFFLDPNTAAPLLQQEFQSAVVAGTAQQAGYQQLDVATAKQLAALGLSQGQYTQGFQQLGLQHQLFNNLPGEALPQGPITESQQLGATFEGNAASQLAINAAQRQRQAQFQGGEQFAETATGVGGLGTAQRT